MMRKSISFLAALFLFTNVHAQTLFTYGNKSVSKQQFLEAYNKNDQGGAKTDSAYNAYLDLYIKYKLKIQAAYDERVDTLYSIKEEVAGYRDQVMAEYLKAQAGYDKIAELEWERASKEILLQQVVVSSSKKDKINEAYNSLRSGASFEDVASRFSEDPAVTVNKGTAGYVTAMVLPFDIELKLYGLKIGEFSPPFLYNGKWVIIKNGGERPSRGKVQVSQVLFSFPPDASESDRKRIRMKADSVYHLLSKGEDFSAIALQFSDDPFSYNHGGELPAFGAGIYERVFEENAFDLKENEISKPFESSYGIHIIKLLKKSAYTPTLDSLTRVQLIEQIQSGDREIVATRQLIGRVSSLLQVKDQQVDTSVLNHFTRKVLENPSSLAEMGWKPSVILFSMNGRKVTVSEYRKYLQLLGQSGNFNDQPAWEFYEGFRNNLILEHYQSNIEKYDPLFRKQLDEFKEGSMLFYMMEKYVWGVATADTAGLRKYFEQNKSKYWWDKSADVLVFSSTNQDLIKTIREAIVKVPERWKEIQEKYENQLTVDSGRYEFSQLPGNPASLGNGEVTPIAQLDDVFTVAYAVNVYNERSPRNFEEAMGLVINDYQGVLEERWINKLKKKYPVKVSQDAKRF